MGKVLTLVLTLILTLGFIACYLFLTVQINTGSLKIAAGQKQLEDGEQMVARGKTKLSSGNQQLSSAKSGYSKIKTLSYMSVVAAPVAGVVALAGNQVIGNQISEGDQMVAQGRSKIKAGEEQLSAGKLQLQHGVQRLALAKKIRIACAIAAVIFAALLIVLVVCWRKKMPKG